jgi:hypothetical protein
MGPIKFRTTEHKLTWLICLGQRTPQWLTKNHQIIMLAVVVAAAVTRERVLCHQLVTEGAVAELIVKRLDGLRHYLACLTLAVAVAAVAHYPLPAARAAPA